MGLKGQKRDTSRDADICRRFKNGETHKQIGDDYGVCRERIRQILKRYGLTHENGGFYKKSAKKKAAEQRARDNKFLVWWGCTRAERALIPKDVQKAFKDKKRNVTTLGMEWSITLPEYWAIWQASGYWEVMSAGDYGMSRKNNKKPWTKNNVHITTAYERTMKRYGCYK
jgi:hypothetical protein